MKGKHYTLLAGLILSAMVRMHAQSYEHLWSRVKQAEEKSLPATVVKLTDSIFLKGRKEKNAPQMMKAYLYRMEYRESLSPDSFYTDLKGLERLSEEQDKPQDRAVTHILLAHIYSTHARRNAYRAGRQADIKDETPEDIREWTSDLFADKVRRHINEAMKDSMALLNTASGDYVPLVAEGRMSRYCGHDLYHLIGQYAAEALTALRSPKVKEDIRRLYDTMIDTYRKRGKNDAVTLILLTRAMNEQSRFEKSKEAYLKELELLRTTHADQEACAEVCIEMAKTLRHSNPGEALRICNEAIARYPTYLRINAAKNLRAELLLPTLQVSHKETVYPGDSVSLSTQYSNLNGFEIRLYQGKKLVKRQHYALSSPGEALRADTVLHFLAPGTGHYSTLRIVPDTPTEKGNPNTGLHVTRFRVLTASVGEDSCDILTLDARTGHPIPQATVRLYDSDERLRHTAMTDSRGKLRIALEDGYRKIQASKGDDTAMPATYLNPDHYYGDFGEHEAREHITLLTDRSIYRPGQTVHVKGVVYEQKGDDSRVLPGREYTVDLLDSSGQSISKQKVRTGEYGSFATTFALPVSCPNGMFVIRTDDDMVYISVEEYKRPSFEVTMEASESYHTPGERISLRGKAETFNGIPVQGATVDYTVKRKAVWYRPWGFSDEGEQIAAGKSATADDGSFLIPVHLEGDREVTDKGMFYRYTIETNVTSTTGETQKALRLIVVGKRALMGHIEMKERIDRSGNDSVTFIVSNLNGEEVSLKGSYRILRMPEKSTVTDGTFLSGRPELPHWKPLESGTYRMVMTIDDAKGDTVTEHRDFVLFDRSDRRPPVYSAFWFDALNTDFDESRAARFRIGTSEKDVCLYYRAVGPKGIVEDKVMRLSDEILDFEYPYRKEYGDGLALSFAFVKNGELHRQDVALKKREPEKTLTLRWEVFRDRLRPGATEEWRLSLRTPQGLPARAEMLAMMYDASLDRIRSHNQSLAPVYDRTVPYFRWSMVPVTEGWLWPQWKVKTLDVPGYVFDRFVTSRYFPPYVDGGLKQGIAYAMSTGNNTVRVRGASKVAFEASDEASPELAAAPSEPSLFAPPAELRVNFAETAFFYPQLRTDEQGNIGIAFTLPESLTAWNFRAYAHTKEMQTGMLKARCTASKDFMLMPQMPRFVRTGDRASLSAAVVNRTDREQTGTVTLTLFDPQTERTIETIRSPFTVAAGQTAGLRFDFETGRIRTLLGCRLVAETPDFSDGEQHLLPVLGNRLRITETMPISLRGTLKRDVSLADLFGKQSPSAEDRRITVEMSGNPLWYAVQSLPSVSVPDEDNTVSLAVACFAGLSSAKIVDGYPRIREVFEMWRRRDGEAGVLQAGLTKNEELKNLLLAESPWVLEARDEREQFGRMALLFDANHISRSLSTMTDRLHALQRENGAWPWYGGMPESPALTAYIAGLLTEADSPTRLSALPKIKLMLQRAFGYLDRTMSGLYRTETAKNRTTGEADGRVPHLVLQHLYNMALSGHEVPRDHRRAHDYFVGLIPGLLRHGSVAEKAMASVILRHAGRHKEAQAFVASLQEHLTGSEERGMFFDFDSHDRGRSMTKMQAHVKAMKAFTLAGSDYRNTVEAMKVWLLKQKQTRGWDSPVSTAEAVTALLSGTDTIPGEHDGVRMDIAGHVIEASPQAGQAVPGTGYVKRTFTDPEAVKARTLKVEKKGDGVAWGAVYAQYESPLRDVAARGNGLSVDRKYYVERNTPAGRELHPLRKGAKVGVGDRVVTRLVIRADRDMDFVCLKDGRAACLEPEDNRSGYRASGTAGYYMDIKDASVNFFFDVLPRGTHLLEYAARATHEGSYATGIATLQCLYAPEFAAHTESEEITVGR